MSFKDQHMTPSLILILLIIGLIAGILSGFVGVGGGVIMVPAMVYFLHLTQHQAQGTSLLVLLFPVGILAVWNYYKAEQINWTFGILIGIGFVAGAYFGSKLSLKLSPGIVKLVFGLLMAYVSFRMISSGYQSLQK